MRDVHDSLHGNMWGYSDTAFFVSDAARETVKLAGNRYDISGRDMPDLFGYMRRVYAPDLAVDAVRRFVEPRDPAPSRVHTAFAEQMCRRFGAGCFTLDERDRLNHSHGHSLHEIYLRNYFPERIALVDAVFYPSSEQHIVDFLVIARTLGLGIVPVGGGTNTSKALLPDIAGARPLVAVNLKRLNRMLGIDTDRRQVTVEAGMTGRQLAERLAEHGYTVGHEPDSLEFSTVGGWIATLSSGMKKNRYGNIEDLTLNCRLVTADGVFDRGTSFARESTGIDLSKLIFGSEGSLGIITAATLKIRKLPQTQGYQSYFFPSFDHGLRFMEQLSEFDTYPASVRLMDSRHFQLAMAVRPDAADRPDTETDNRNAAMSGFLREHDLNPEHIASCTIVFEGFTREVAIQQAIVAELAASCDGVASGADAGAAGYRMTFAIAYIRDFFLSYGILGESMETTIAWNKVALLCRTMTETMEAYSDRYGLSRPVLMYRISQIYRTEALVYFYYVQYAPDANAANHVFDIQAVLRHLIVELGGSVSHHHGVGKIKRDLMQEVLPDFYRKKLAATKAMFDRDNLFCLNNAGIGDEWQKI